MNKIPLGVLIGLFLAIGAGAVLILMWPKSYTASNNSVIVGLNVNRTASISNQNLVAPPSNNGNANLPVNNLMPNANIAPVNANPSVSQSNLVLPISNYFARVTKKPFGIYVTPQHSPVHPEKFTGYHTGADAETTPAEANIDVPIFSITAGQVVFAGHVNGYGGVIIVRAKVGSETVTILYGHLRMASFSVKLKDQVSAGQQMAVLGTGYSSETDGERKHLHLGIIKGAAINYRGYVSTASQLSAWYDPVKWLEQHGLKP